LKESKKDKDETIKARFIHTTPSMKWWKNREVDYHSTKQKFSKENTNTSKQ